MEEYKVAKERCLRESPDSLISNGIANFGSFRSPIKNLNLLEVRNQSKWLLDCFNSFRLTEWEACEINFDTGAIVLAVYKNMRLNGMGILIYFDKLQNKIYSYRRLGLSSMAKVAKSLYNSVSYIDERGFSLKISNDCENKRAVVEAELFDKENGSLSLHVAINEINMPSVVSIPLGENKPLYSQKSFFKASGSLKFKNKEYDINGSAIIDDHKGYYPYKAHYDWLTSMGYVEYEGRSCAFAFNLTKNQSIDEEKYNENNIWLDSSFYYLPPVSFIKGKDRWLIRDKYGNVSLEFKLLNSFIMNSHLLLFDIKYSLPFGYVNGFLKTHDGKLIEIKNLLGIAEDKTTRL